MVFTPKNWEDAPSTATPLSAVALEDMETRLAAYTDSVSGGTFSAASYAGGSNGAAGQIAQAVTDAVAAITATRGAIVYIPAGLWDCTGGGSISGAVASIPKDLLQWLRIVGDDGTVIRLSANIPRLFDLTRAADDDTFRRVAVENLHVDANNVGGVGHVVLGNLYPAGGTPAHQVNIDQIRVQGVRTVNVLRGTSSATDWRIGVALHCWNNGDAADAQHMITDVEIEDFHQDGGLSAINIAGMPYGGGVLTANVWLDEIHVRRGSHDEGTVPSQFNAGNHVMIGNKGFGGRATITDFYGANCSDCGFEINAIQDFTGTRLKAMNAWNHGFYHAPYHAAKRPDSQIHTWVDCTGVRDDTLGANIRAAGVAGSAQGLHYASKSNGNYPANVTVRGYQWESTAQVFTLGEAIDLNGPKRASIDGFHGESDIGTYTGSTAVTSSLVRVASLDTSQIATARVNGYNAKIRGTKSGTGSVTYYGLVVGNVGRLDFRVERPVIDFSLNSAICYGMMVGDNGATPSVWGTIKSPAFATGGASAAAGIRIGRSGNTAIQGAVTIEDPDFSQMQSTATELDLQAPTNGHRVQVVRPRWRTAKAPTALTVSASPYTFQNQDGYAQRVIVKGGTVSLVELVSGDAWQGNGTTASGSASLTSVTTTWGSSVNGMVLYGAGIPDGTTVSSGGGTATITMSANGTAPNTATSVQGAWLEDTGQTQGAFVVGPGERLRVTYSVAPTMRKVPPVATAVA